MARKVSLPGMADEIEQEAVDFLRQHEPEEGYQLCFSGGKDSIVMRHLADLAGVKYRALFNCTTIDPPQIYAFIKKHYPDTTWHFPKRNFFKLIEKKGPAWRKVRWCCHELKESGDIPGLSRLLIGIRAEESRMRAARPRIEPARKRKGNTFYAPLHGWKEWQIWEHIEKWGLPYPSLYDEGYSRIGCKLCPMTFGPSDAAQTRLRREKERYPRFVKRFEAALRVWFDASNAYRAEKGMKIWHEDFGKFLKAYYMGFKGRGW